MPEMLPIKVQQERYKEEKLMMYATAIEHQETSYANIQEYHIQLNKELRPTVFHNTQL